MRLSTPGMRPAAWRRLRRSARPRERAHVTRAHCRSGSFLLRLRHQVSCSLPLAGRTGRVRLEVLRRLSCLRCGSPRTRRSAGRAERRRQPAGAATWDLSKQGPLDAQRLRAVASRSRVADGMTETRRPLQATVGRAPAGRARRASRQRHQGLLRGASAPTAAQLRPRSWMTHSGSRARATESPDRGHRHRQPGWRGGDRRPVRRTIQPPRGELRRARAAGGGPKLGCASLNGRGRRVTTWRRSRSRWAWRQLAGRSASRRSGQGERETADRRATASQP